MNAIACKRTTHHTEYNDKCIPICRFLPFCFVTFKYLAFEECARGLTMIKLDNKILKKKFEYDLEKINYACIWDLVFTVEC